MATTTGSRLTERITVRLSAEAVTELDAEVIERDYGDRSEAIRQILREHQARRAAIG